MRKWLLTAGCAALLIAGASCSKTESQQPQKNTEPKEQLLLENTIPSQLSIIQHKDDKNYSQDASNSPNGGNPPDASGQDDAGPQSPGGGHVEDIAQRPKLTSLVHVQQLDDIFVPVRGIMVYNEPVGYYLYILPGFRAEINSETGSMTLTAADNGTQAVIEALPPQIDMQLASEELSNVMMLIDEDMRKITEYMRHDFWSDATIYRAYNGDSRITAILKAVQDIPLRITISEPTDVHELHQIMGMISSVGTADKELNSQMTPDILAEMLAQIHLLQTSVVGTYQEPAINQNVQRADELPADRESADKGSTNSNSPDKELTDKEESTDKDSAELYANWISPSVELFIQSSDDLLAYFETLYTPEAAKKALEQLGIMTVNGKLAAKRVEDGSPMHWDQASLQLISETENTQRYLARVPAGSEVDKSYKIQEIEVRKTALGWRLNTPLVRSTKLPVISTE